MRHNKTFHRGELLLHRLQLEASDYPNITTIDSRCEWCFSRYLIVCGHYNLFENKLIMNQHQPSTGFSAVAEAKKCAKALEVETGLDCGWLACLEVYSVVITSSRLIVTTTQFKSMPVFTEDAALHRDREREGESCSTFALQMQISHKVGRWIHNKHGFIDWGQVLQCRLRGQKVTGSNKKSNVDPLDHDWLNFAFSRSPSPQNTACFYLIVCRLSATVTSAAHEMMHTERDAGLSVCHQPKTSSYMVNYEIYRSFWSHGGIRLTIL